MAEQTCFGVRVHLRVCWPGLVVGFEVAPVDAHELRAAQDLLAGVKGDVLGDRDYWSPALAGQLRVEGLRLPTPFRPASREPKPCLPILTTTHSDRAIPHATAGGLG